MVYNNNNNNSVWRTVFLKRVLMKAAEVNGFSAGGGAPGSREGLPSALTNIRTLKFTKIVFVFSTTARPRVYLENSYCCGLPVARPGFSDSSPIGSLLYYIYLNRKYVDLYYIYVWLFWRINLFMTLTIT